jgi:colanic acid/amylovoran biosynthesis protein
MSLNILLITVHSWRNLGDRALCEAALEQLHKNFDNCRITAAINDLASYAGADPAVPSMFAWVTHTSKGQSMRFIWSVFAGTLAATWYRISHKIWTGIAPEALRPILKAYLEADLVVSSPGGYFFSYGPGRAWIMLAFSMALALLAGKPLYLFPQSFGPLQNAWERRLGTWILCHARMVMAREPISYDFLMELGVTDALGERCRLLPDTAFTFHCNPAEKEADLKQALTWLHDHGINPDSGELDSKRPLLGMTIMDWALQEVSFDRQEAYEFALEATARHFVQTRKGHIILLPQTSGPTRFDDDRPATMRLAGRLADLGNACIAVETPLPPGTLQAVLGKLDLFVGTRMHSNIFALNGGVPVIAIGYLHKTRGIARSLGIEEWVIDIQNVDEKILIERLECLWSQREQIRVHLAQRLPIILEEANQAGVLVAKDFRLARGQDHPSSR